MSANCYSRLYMRCLSLNHGMLSPAKSPSQEWWSQCQKKLTLIPVFSHCNVCRNLNEVIMCFKYIGLGPEKINVCHRWLQDDLVYNNAMGQVTLPRAWYVTRQSRGRRILWIPKDIFLSHLLQTPEAWMQLSHVVHCQIHIPFKSKSKSGSLTQDFLQRTK